MPIKCYTEYTNGFPGGEGEQHPKGIAGCPAAPDHVYLSIDIAGTWRSTNAGRSWIKNLDDGLYLQELQTCAVDPLDAQRIFTVASAPSGQESNYGHLSGIYRSDDGGAHWTNVLRTPTLPARSTYHRLHRTLFACRPPRPGATRATVWYACLDNNGIFTSTNSGVSWSVYLLLPSKVFYSIAVFYDDMTGEDALYIGSEEGLYRYRRQGGVVTRQDLRVPKTYEPPAGFEGGVSALGLAGTTPGYAHAPPRALTSPAGPAPPTRMRDRAGNILPRSAAPPTPALPANVTWPRQTAVPAAALPYAGARLTRIWAARFYDKAYYTDDPAPTSAAQWIEANLYDETGAPLTIGSSLTNDWPGAGYARLLFVNPYSNEYAYLSCGSQFFYLVTINGAPRWVRVPRATGFTNNPTIATYVKRINGNHTGLAFDPRNPSEIVAYANATPFRSESAGRSWQQSNAGYTGYAWTFGRATAQFSRQDSNTVMLMCNDIGPVISTSHWDWFWSSNSGGTPPGLWKGTTAGDIDPDNVSNIVCLMGIYSTGFRPVRSDDAGFTYYYPAGTNIPVNYRYARCVRYVNPSTLFAAYMMSSNDADSLSLVNFNIAYPGRVAPPGIGSDPPWTVIDAATNAVHPILYAGDCASYRYILRGEYTNGLYRWSRVYDDAAYTFKQFIGSPILAADPHNISRIYGAASLGTYLVRYDTNNGLTNTPGNIERTYFTPYLPRQSGFAFYNAITEIEPDPTELNVVYVGTAAPGLPCVFKVRYTGPATISIEDITGDLPRIGMRSLRVDPWRGDLYVGTHAGTFVLRNP